MIHKGQHMKDIKMQREKTLKGMQKRQKNRAISDLLGFGLLIVSGITIFASASLLILLITFWTFAIIFLVAFFHDLMWLKRITTWAPIYEEDKWRYGI